MHHYWIREMYKPMQSYFVIQIELFPYQVIQPLNPVSLTDNNASYHWPGPDLDVKVKFDCG